MNSVGNDSTYVAFVSILLKIILPNREKNEKHSSTDTSLTLSKRSYPSPKSTLSNAQSADGSYISWQEHIIDEPELAGFALSGSDGLVMGDIDRDGHEDIVSVHESDT